MSLCVFCGHPTVRGEDLCSYHDSGHDEKWSVGNRLMCDFLHRGVVSSLAAARRVREEPQAVSTM
jgi:hypothetical protein